MRFATSNAINFERKIQFEAWKNKKNVFKYKIIRRFSLVERQILARREAQMYQDKLTALAMNERQA